jgi:hypothetical protein
MVPYFWIGSWSPKERSLTTSQVFAGIISTNHTTNRHYIVWGANSVIISKIKQKYGSQPPRNEIRAKSETSWLLNLSETTDNVQTPWFRMTSRVMQGFDAVKSFLIFQMILLLWGIITLNINNISRQKLLNKCKCIHSRKSRWILRNIKAPNISEG